MAGPKVAGQCQDFERGPTGLMLPERWREIKDIGRYGELQREEKLMRCCGDAVPTTAVLAVTRACC